MSETATIVWFRGDLRLADNPALAEAVSRGGPVLPVFVWSPDEEGAWSPGAASKWWLDASLRALASSLEALGSRLLVRRGPALEALRSIVAESGAGAVLWNRRYEPEAITRDGLVKKALREDGLHVRSFNSSLLLEPWENTKQDGTPYRVFTPFWKAMLRSSLPSPAASVSQLVSPQTWPQSLAVEGLDLLPRPDWAGGMRAAWTPGEAGAEAALDSFLASALAQYPTQRDVPAGRGTSALSPHLHFGEIGPRTIWKAVRELASTQTGGDLDAGAEAWLRQLAWRDFAHHLLFHFPSTTHSPLRPEFARFAWSNDAASLRAWQRGLTGYPLVDAGMRELWTTGWMHNRVRMIAASFLVKDLRIAWQQGAKWFWDTLVDADLANNTLGWQWTAGCGADAAPYFRVFNPLLQSRRFDPDGVYLKRWLPELARLDAKWIHEPHAAPAAVLEAAGVTIGRTYPAPIVAHDSAKKLALEAFHALGEET